MSLAQGDSAAARAHCRDILEAVPGDGGALHLLGVMAHQDSDPAAAEAYLRQAAESPGAPALYLLSYAELCLKPRDPPAALALTRRAVALDPRSPLGWYSLGTQLLDAREYEEARESLERALRLDPALWRARVQLAVLASRRGDHGGALERFRTLLAELAGNGEVLSQHAAFLQEIGRPAEALAQIERAAHASPDSLEPHLRAAEIELTLGRSEQALNRLERLSPRWAHHPEFIAAKATLLRLTDRCPEAVAVCREAFARGLRSTDLLRAYGQALHLAGQDEEALAVLEQAGARRPALALSDKAVILTQLGRFAEASECFDRALEHEPALAETWYDKANAKSFVLGDPDIEAMHRLLAAGCSHRDRMLLNFALGKAHSECGETGQAFEHWEAGNRLRRELIEYDAHDTHAQLQSLVTARFPDVNRAALSSSRRSEVPVFIVGMPRCGSSLVEQILSSHPDVHGGGEQLRLRDLFAPHCLGFTGDEDADAAAADAADAALAILRRASPVARRVIDKDLANFRYLGVIYFIFPNARIIHCRRDALDTCFSAYTKLFLGDFPYAYDLRELGLYYRSYQSLMGHWRRQLPARALLEIDYETLVAEPRATTAALLEFLGVPWNEASLRFFDTPRSVATASAVQVRRPIYRSSVGRSAPLLARLKPLADALAEPARTGKAP